MGGRKSSSSSKAAKKNTTATTPKHQPDPIIDTPIDDNTDGNLKVNQAEALDYWSAIDATNDGMLGGLGAYSSADLKLSTTFLQALRQRRGDEPNTLISRAIDGGAGIGRVSAGLLQKFCRTIDIVEPVAKFAGSSEIAALRDAGKVEDVFVMGLESFEPARQYELFWNQWCLGQLNDAQVVSYLVRCKKNLTPGGWIVVKDNLGSDPDGLDQYDEEGSVVSRTQNKWEGLFVRAGLHVISTALQGGFPKGLLGIRMWALQPDS